MSSELDSRLDRLLSDLPEPAPESGERALRRALAALPARPPHPRRRVRAVVLLPAAALALLALAAGALAAAGALHVGFERSVPSRTAARGAAVRGLEVPRGARGIAAVVDGRLWLTTSSGLRLEGLPVSAAALSPRALYVAAGVGDALVAMAPDGRRAWSHPTPGRVAAIAWAPDGLRIAYVVHAGSHFRLHLIEGNGRDDTLVDRAVRPVRPSWRADSLAVAYAGAGGRPVVYDLGHRSRTVVAAAAARDPTRLAFAPSGMTLAVGTSHSFVVTAPGARPNGFDFAPAPVAGLGWLNGRLALAVDGAFPSESPFVQLFSVRKGYAEPRGSVVPPGPIQAFDAQGGRLTIAVSAAHAVRVISSSPGAPAKRVPLPRPRIVLELPPATRVGSLAVR